MLGPLVKYFVPTYNPHIPTYIDIYICSMYNSQYVCPRSPKAVIPSPSIHSNRSIKANPLHFAIITYGVGSKAGVPGLVQLFDTQVMPT